MGKTLQDVAQEIDQELSSSRAETDSAMILGVYAHRAMTKNVSDVSLRIGDYVAFYVPGRRRGKSKGPARWGIGKVTQRSRTRTKVEECDPHAKPTGMVWTVNRGNTAWIAERGSQPAIVQEVVKQFAERLAQIAAGFSLRPEAVTLSPHLITTPIAAEEKPHLNPVKRVVKAPEEKQPILPSAVKARKGRFTSWK